MGGASIEINNDALHTSAHPISVSFLPLLAKGIAQV